MSRSNKCGSVRYDETINLHFGSGAGPVIIKAALKLMANKEL